MVPPLMTEDRNAPFRQVMDDWLLPNKWLSPDSVDWVSPFLFGIVAMTNIQSGYLG